tara:strand:+ start:7332 stop:7697 length:366 start_codon:yes stop_codon:yes gene_type:complete
MATVKIDGLSPDCEYDNVNGALEITRRLSDKVLAAFNHAYATGEIDVAQKLRDVLQITESRRPRGDKRTGYDAVVHADLWMSFVKSRDAYKALCDTAGAKPAALAKAQDAMKSAYRAWSEI